MNDLYAVLSYGRKKWKWKMKRKKKRDSRIVYVLNPGRLMILAEKFNYM